MLAEGSNGFQGLLPNLLAYSNRKIYKPHKPRPPGEGDEVGKEALEVKDFTL